MGVHDGGAPNDGVLLSRAKRGMQEEKLAGVSKLLSGPSGADALTISWAAMLLRRLGGSGLSVQESQMYVLQSLGQTTELNNDSDLAGVG